MRSTANRSVLALHNKSNGTALGRVDGVRVSRQEGNDDTRSPSCSFLVRTDDSVDKSISDSIMDRDAVDDGRSDEELVLNVDKVLGQLDS